MNVLYNILDVELRFNGITGRLSTRRSTSGESPFVVFVDGEGAEFAAFDAGAVEPATGADNLFAILEGDEGERAPPIAEDVGEGDARTGGGSSLSSLLGRDVTGEALDKDDGAVEGVETTTMALTRART